MVKRRRIDDVPPLPRPAHTYPRETETRKYATEANKLVDANMVITFNFGTKISTLDLVAKAPLSMWLMSSSVLTKLANPKTTCLIFASGKGLIVGVKSLQHGLLAAWQVVCVVRGCGVRDAAVHGFHARNVTSTAMMDGFVDIMLLERNPGMLHFADLENHIFPGIYLKSVDKKVNITVAVFVSGKVNVTGAKSATQTEHHINAVIRYIRACLVTGAAEKKELEARAQALRKEKHRRAEEVKLRKHAEGVAAAAAKELERARSASSAAKRKSAVVDGSGAPHVGGGES
jgi:TATA-box binding protein (TBP) (component of TFIID and TFIIIB)